ncbi:MAG: fumarylacetoacetate hydrolase family protein [Hyphomicrobiaceae bacterium]|mgnify:CR=1 FL=1
MKLLRHGAAGRERPGIVDKSGAIRDLSGVIDDLSAATLRRAALAKIAKVDPAILPLVPANTRIGPCIDRVGHFIAVGLNYADHAKETGSPIPAEPILFSKAPSCLHGPDDDVIIPKGSTKSDWEVELAVIIGEPASYVSEAKALDHVAGYAVCNDLSERAWQMERGGQWIKGKSAPTFGPLGPWLVTPDEIADVQKLKMWLELNGSKVQNGSTETMIFGVAHLISYISQFWRLEPGDVITTGTPPGVGLGMKPPKFLKAGDHMRLSIEGLGVQTQKVVAYQG